MYLPKTIGYRYIISRPLLYYLFDYNTILYSNLVSNTYTAIPIFIVIVNKIECYNYHYYNCSSNLHRDYWTGNSLSRVGTWSNGIPKLTGFGIGVPV